MFKYKVTDAGKKEKIKEKLPELEELVDKIMLERMRWDIHYYSPSADVKKIGEESKSKSEPIE